MRRADAFEELRRESHKMGLRPTGADFGEKHFDATFGPHPEAQPAQKIRHSDFGKLVKRMAEKYGRMDIVVKLQKSAPFTARIASDEPLQAELRKFVEKQIEAAKAKQRTE